MRERKVGLGGGGSPAGVENPCVRACTAARPPNARTAPVFLALAHWHPLAHSQKLVGSAEY